MAFNGTEEQTVDQSAPVMSVSENVSNDSENGEAALRPRYYQLEMLEESLKFPKALSAQYYESKRNSNGAPQRKSASTVQATAQGNIDCMQLVFVLVPTVALAAQWHTVISAQLPAIETRFLSGADGVDRWSDQWIWDEFLLGVRVVVCTYQILLDTLIHGFIQMSALGLIIFDEAHHCVASHPANRIMIDFYHTKEPQARPQIMGLTASPQTNGKEDGLECVERNLDAIARTPKFHREELLQHVFPPELVRLRYQDNATTCPKDLQRLRELYSDLDIEKDPYIIKLRADPSTSDSKQLRKALYGRKTYCLDQIKSLCNKSEAIFDELGSWATQFYIHATIEKFCSKAEIDNMSMLEVLDDTEKLYLRKILRSIRDSTQSVDGLQQSTSTGIDRIDFSSTRACLSSKVQCLIEYLASLQISDFTGLIFVKTRATCAVLGHILSVHEKTRDSYRVSTYVGTSASAYRKFDMGELVDIKNQRDTLDHLRHGHKNLVIATSVLEEGIDVSACNVVICFERPPNLKAFIQRRGRARKSRSKYVLIFPEHDSMSQLATFQRLEDEMRQRYMNEMRQVEQLRLLEAADTGRREFYIESTGAKLTLDDAVQHLYHFCATLCADPYVDLRPIFTFTQPCEDGPVRAEVRLPNSVNPIVRHASSPSEWTSKKLAKRDAAFEAYIALYHAGLISDNLLPIRGHSDEAVTEAQSAVEKIASVAGIDEQLDVWSSVAHDWRDGSPVHSYSVQVSCEGLPSVQMSMLLPRPLAHSLEMELYWDAFTTLQVSVRQRPSIPRAELPAQVAADCTSLLLNAVFKTRMDGDRTDFVALFVPADQQDLAAWYNQNHGTAEPYSSISKVASANAVGIVRDLNHNGVPHVFGGIEWLQPHRAIDQLDGAQQSLQEADVAEKEMYIKARRLPKRSDFLHQIPLQDLDKSELSSKFLPASDCVVDRLPLVYSQFALLVPSIMHKVEINMVADDLCKNVLASVEFSNLSVVLTAISTTAAREPTNYQRLEFLGDSILKTFTSLTLLATHLNWHEGVLSHQKDHIVSNANLARASLAKGLDKYILTKPFTGSKWRPLYVSDLLSERKAAPRQLSTKTLADLVESLIGGAYLEGGIAKALACLHALLPTVKWAPLEQLCSILYSLYDIQVTLPAIHEPLMTMLDHKFKLPSLILEAITHPSHHGATPSYQRLEFLGDSILDRIITVTAFNHTPEIETHTLHLIRTALVNANFLAYHCLTLSTPVSKNSITRNPDGTHTAIESSAPLPLWTFMRHSAPAVRTAQAACNARFQALKDPIATVLRNGEHYPWSLLAALEAPKFFSDIIESIIGAIYVDTHGEIEAVEAFLEKLGILAYLRRVMQRGKGAVAVKHPKEELGVVADTERVRYEVFRGKREVKEGVEGKEMGGDEGKEGGGKGELKCRVWVGERIVVEVGEGVSVIEVETRGAEEAVRMLKADKMEL